VADPVNGSGQIVSDPSQGVAHSNESDLSFNAPSELSQIQPYSSQGQALTPVAYSYDTAGNQTGNDGAGMGNPLTISYLPTNQTQSISNTSQQPVAMTWTGPGQSERVSRSWTDSGTTYTDHFTYTPLGLGPPELQMTHIGACSPGGTTAAIGSFVHSGALSWPQHEHPDHPDHELLHPRPLRHAHRRAQQRQDGVLLPLRQAGQCGWVGRPRHDGGELRLRGRVR
jgi:hypothetical protein